MWYLFKNVNPETINLFSVDFHENRFLRHEGPQPITAFRLEIYGTLNIEKAKRWANALIQYEFCDRNVYPFTQEYEAFRFDIDVGATSVFPGYEWTPSFREEGILANIKSRASFGRLNYSFIGTSYIVAPKYQAFSKGWIDLI